MERGLTEHVGHSMYRVAAGERLELLKSVRVKFEYARVARCAERSGTRCLLPRR